MEVQHLHIISFNVPYPPNYGGVIDVYYKLKALSLAGVRITLHCFQYGREKAEKLSDYCEKTYYYPRRISLAGIFKPMPFIVSTRDDQNLLSNLRADNAPILFEGLHTTCHLSHPALQDRLKLVRMHNIEWQYYLHLSKLETNWVKKLYFNREAKNLKTYETVLEQASSIIAISKGDYNYYSELFPEKAVFVPAFHENELVTGKPGTGDFALYHGDLSVKDNEEAVMFLIREIFNTLNVKFVIAGLNPDRKLKNEVEKYDHIDLIPNPDFKTMRELISDAQVNLLYSFQSAGMKLKLINALYRGRHCIVNDKMTGGSELSKLCVIKNTGSEIAQSLLSLMRTEFSETDKRKRVAVLQSRFSNAVNAQKLLDLI